MPRPKKSQSGNLREEILATAWQQISEEGASALSLRGIARQLSITAPAIYNYFPRRDDLVTELIIDAFLSFGDAQIAALQAIPTGDHTGRLRALGLAYRQWAVSYPQRYMLIFGAPIPGYAAPAERTTPAAARAFRQVGNTATDFQTVMGRFQQLLAQIEQDPSRFVYQQPSPVER